MGTATNFETIDEEIDAIVDRARSWPIGVRFRLLDRVLATIEGGSKPPGEAGPTGNIAHLIGLLKTDGPPPTDEEIDRMLHDARMGRYGS